jgi:hypothetical protein
MSDPKIIAEHDGYTLSVSDSPPDGPQKPTIKVSRGEYADTYETEAT